MFKSVKMSFNIIALSVATMMGVHTAVADDHEVSVPVGDILPRATAMTAEQLSQILAAHPRQLSSLEAICESKIGISVAKTAYFPKLSANLSGGNKLIDKTTRSDEFGGTNSPEYDGKGVNATLSISQLLYDWGVTGNSVQVEREKTTKARLVNRETADAQTLGLLDLSFKLDAAAKAIVIGQQTLDKLNSILANTEKKYKLGAGTLTEVKELSLMVLQREGLLQSATLKYENLVKSLKNQYGVSLDQAAALRSMFVTLREEQPTTLGVEASLDYRQNELDLEIAKLEDKKLSRSRFPKIQAELAGRAWDIQEQDSCGMITGSDVFGNIQRLRDDCRAYEATGNLSLSMPLYDGGENKNRRRGIASQIRRLTSVERSIMRDHQVTASELVSQLTDLTRASDDNVKQIAALTSRLADITRLQESTQSNFPLLASLSDKLGDLEIQQANVVSELENTRAQIYSLNDQLVDILAVSLEQPQC